MKILVTGTAGFIGFHLAEALAKEGHDVTGLDNINHYYDVRLKYARLAESGISEGMIEYNNFAYSNKYPNYKFIKLNLEDNENIQALFKSEKFEVVCNLAAQAGVRYSIKNPYSYIQSNIVGFLNILEACRHNNIQHLVYASSSSVYGNSDKVPFSENDVVNKPVSLYAATKISNELMAYTYSHLYNLRTTGLRFFTVYGPWGRPDMAPFIFLDSILRNESIRVFNNGQLKRDFTYIDDTIRAIKCVVHLDLSKDYDILNIGNSKPILLLDFITTLENIIGTKASKIMTTMQPGDVVETFSSTDNLRKSIEWESKTELSTGLTEFVNWFKKYYSIK